MANFDNVHVVTRSALVEKVGQLPAARHCEAKRALGYALRWPELMAL